MPQGSVRMRAASKLSGEERRAAIIQAVRRVFSEKGFHATTTRELADAAGVSEALLFKHFPTKEALFTSMQAACCNEHDQGRFDRLRSLVPSASTLVLLVHFLVSRMVGGRRSPDEEQVIQQRLMLRSLAEDGEFARLFMRRIADHWIPTIEQSLRAAIVSGEVSGDAVQPALCGWFVNHLAAMIMFNQLPEPPVVDYGASRSTLVQESVKFMLRGMGLTESSIRLHYNPEALALFEER